LSWDFGDASPPVTVNDPSQNTIAHEFASGPYVVTLVVTYLNVIVAEQTTATENIVVAPNAAPTARFAFSPTGPLIDQDVFFVSQSSDAEDQLGRLAHAWDFGDGATASGQGATHAFKAPGSYNVTLTVTDTEGASAFESRAVAVSPPPSQTPPPSLTEPLRLISPFPIVRLSGLLTEKGADIQRLAVRAPKGVTAAVRCRGKACPVRRSERTITGNSTRFKRFERELPAGTVLRVLVTRPGRIGKYTRFRIRRDRAPKRTDRCLVFGASKPSACPAS
jgi:hypothetical protein